MKILIVDDSAVDRRLLRYLVDKKGHVAIEAENGFDGLKAARASRPDLIISDALMPVMDGFQFLREAKQDPDLRAIPFIFYSSSYKDYQDVRLAVSLGAAAYIIKPVDPLELWKKIETIMTAEKQEVAAPVPLIKEDAEYLKRYSEVVATKLEEKVQELEMALEDRQQAEAALRERESFIKNILESVDEGFIVIDGDYRVLSVNRAFCRQVKAAESEIVGRPCHLVAHHSIRPCFEAGEECPVRHTFETGLSYSVVHTHADTTGGNQYVEIKSYPIVDDSGKTVSAIETINDITDKRKLEDQLRQAQKMEAVGTLAGGVAHDFNNILTAIIGYGNIVKMKMKQDDPLRTSVDTILSSAERAAHLTQGLLAFSRKQIINPKPVDLNGIVRGIDKLLRRIIGEDVDLTAELCEGEITVLADAGQIEQVLMNLATNARDAMPGGGELSITTQRAYLDDDFMKLHAYGKPGDYVLICVSDTGTGMDPQTKEKIFEPFFTTKELGRGTGLGLSIVYGIIRQHNGSISVYSEPEKGTTFKIYLPLVAAAVEARPDAAAAPLPGGTETILLAEDDENVRALTMSVLSDFGYHVIDAVDGQDALDKFTRHANEIDLLILDVIMPKKSGREIYDVVKSVRPDVGILFMSGYAADILHRKGIFEEGLEFISKPLGPHELLWKVRGILDKKQQAA